MGERVRPGDREAADSGAQPEEGADARSALRARRDPALEVDTQHPIGYGIAADTYGFYINSPFFSLVEGFNSQQAERRRALSEHRT